MLLITFAVAEEAAPFSKFARARTDLEILITGMGAANSRDTISKRLAVEPRPASVLTCGFAGALNPQLKNADLLYDSDPAFPAGLPAACNAPTGEGRGEASPILHSLSSVGRAKEDALTTLHSKFGAIRARFHCSNRIATTAVEKHELWKTTTCDAVEMESAIIRNLCAAQSIPSATLRVISDTAHENLPLDFNLCLTEKMTIAPLKLAAQIALHPLAIPALIRFRKTLTAAANRLAAALAQLVLTAD